MSAEPAAPPEPPPAEPATPSAEDERAPAPPPARVLNPPAAAVVAQIARQLRIPPAQIEVLEEAHASWPDACLGLPAEGEICASAITPGYSVAVAAEGQRYDYRTDETGARIRLASGPLPEIGEPIVTWRDSRSFQTLVVGTQRVAFGLRGRSLLAVPLPVPERASELQRFLAGYAPFQAHTPAGEVVFRGVGAARASGVEQRMIAEWARLVAREAAEGREARLDDRALVWRRTGGPTGGCDMVTIDRVGRAVAWSCRGGPERPVASVNLETSELEQLYGWIDRFEPLAWTSQDADGAAADALTIELTMNGSGFELAGDAERERMLSLVNTVVRRLFVKRAAGGS